MFYRIIKALGVFYAKVFYFLKTTGRENTQMEGAFIIAPNHQAPFLIFRRYADRHDGALCLICEECHPRLGAYVFPLLYPGPLWENT